MRSTFRRPMAAAAALAALALLSGPLPARALVSHGAPEIGRADPAKSSRRKGSNAALVVGGIGGGLLLGTVIANANRPPPPQVVVVQPPPPPVVVQQAAQPQPLPPNCQRVVQMIGVAGIAEPQQAVSIACRRPDGTWEYR
ncbi:MAG: hypothetical protein L6R19_20965 [Alphaproteobacteria bacterium]|nr:hypothetical protein [Alphaproteobacteria bacterium]